MGSEKYKRCFEPLTIKGVTFKNRIVCTPHIHAWGSRGLVTAEQAAEYERIAAGGPAIVTLGNCAVNMKECSDEVSQIDLSQEPVLLGLNVLRERVNRWGCQISAQINYAGRNAWYPGSVFYAPSPIPSPGELERAAAEGRRPRVPIELTKEKIIEIEDLYIGGAIKLKRAGFNVIQLHCAHNNLIGQFFSPISNHRTDEYGCDTYENRTRFVMNILRGIRKACGNDLIIDIRMSGEDKLPNALTVDEAVEISKIMEPYCDIFTISNAFHMAPPSIAGKMSLGMYLPQIPLVDYTWKFKNALKKAKITFTTCVMDLDNAEKLLESGVCDFVGMFRPFLADPDIVKKSARGKIDDINFCIRCEYHNRFIFHRPIGCAVNPLVGHSLEFPYGKLPQIDEPKKLMIVGGGPAGMQAAVTARKRGFDVVLHEAKDRLGGALYWAQELPFKREIEKYTNYIIRQVEASGAEIKLGVKATPETVAAENPDFLFIAIGGDYTKPPIKGIDGPNVCYSYEADAGEVELGDEIVIIGGGLVGMESAMYFARDCGKKVTVIDAAPQAACAAACKSNYPAFLQWMDEGGADYKLIYDAAITEIKDGSVVFFQGGRMQEIKADNVLVATGMRPKIEEIDSFRHTLPETDVYILGYNCVNGTIGDATNAAFDIAAHVF